MKHNEPGKKGMLRYCGIVADLLGYWRFLAGIEKGEKMPKWLRDALKPIYGFKDEPCEKA